MAIFFSFCISVFFLEDGPGRKGRQIFFVRVQKKIGLNTLIKVICVGNLKKDPAGTKKLGVWELSIVN